MPQVHCIRLARSTMFLQRKMKETAEHKHRTSAEMESPLSR